MPASNLLRHAHLVISTVGTIRRYTAHKNLPCLGPLLDDLMLSLVLLLEDSQAPVPVAAASAAAPAPAFQQSVIHALDYLIAECEREHHSTLLQPLLEARAELHHLSQPRSTAAKPSKTRATHSSR